MEIRLGKLPHKQQQKFLDCSAPEQLYGGAKRGGKSVALCQKAVLLSYFFPGNRGLLCRYNFTDLKDTTLNEFWQVCPPDLIVNHNKTDRCITLKTMQKGVFSTILYRGLGDEQDFEKTKGLTIGWLAIDEPTEVPWQQYMMLRAQLTWALPDGSKPVYMCLLASNPEPGWVEDRFIEEQNEGCVYIPSLPRDNPHLPDGYESSLRSILPADWVKKYLDGVWGSSEGAIFKDLGDATHNLDNFVSDSDFINFTWGLTLVGSIDHATTGVTCFSLYGVDLFGNNYGLHEYYESDKTIRFHAEQMRMLMDIYCNRPQGFGGNRKPQFILIDPACYQKNQQGSESQVMGTTSLQAVADIYRDNGIHTIPAWNALEMGFDLIKEHLVVSPLHMHPFLSTLGSPSLFLSKSRMPYTWKQVRSIKKKVDSITRQVRIIGVDHALDTLRYFTNSRPRRPEIEASDAKYGSTLDRLARDTHNKWASQWAKTDSNTWFEGMNMNTSNTVRNVIQ